MPADLTLASDEASRGDGRNPFSVAVMREALRNLRRPAKQDAPESAGAAGELRGGEGERLVVPIGEPDIPMPCRGCGGDDIQPTHHYVRYRPTDADQLAELADAGLELSLEPLDETVAASTPAPDPNAAQIPWLYTAVPTDAALPAAVQQVPQERLTELFLFAAEDGDAGYQDPWEPQPPVEPYPCEPQWAPSCRCYIPCAQERPAAARRPRRNRIRQATEQFKKAGISPRALYNEAMRLTLHADEQLQAPDATVQARYSPSGTILVEELTSRNSGRPPVPLRGVTVRARRWFNLFANGQTNQNGQFYINRSFSKKARVMVEFKNDWVTTRGITPAMAPWGLVLPIRHELGLYDRNGMQGLTYTFSYESNSSSKGALSWTAATLFNTVDDMHTYCAATGIPRPPLGLNVMLSSFFTSGASAPMLRRISETSFILAVVDILLPPWATILKRVVQRQLPDITCNYDVGGTTRRTDDLDNTFFHELGHTIHYGQVGNPFWVNYIGYIVRAAERGRSSTYGRKTDEGAGLIAVSEAWGKYIGNIFTARKYDAIDRDIAFDNRWELESRRPNNDPDDTKNWIVSGMFYDMTDTGEPTNTGVTDNVNIYTTPQLLWALQPDVITVRRYQQRVVSQNNNQQAVEMEQLVTSYLW